jgi:hypothetical protein
MYALSKLLCSKLGGFVLLRSERKSVEFCPLPYVSLLQTAQQCTYIGKLDRSCGPMVISMPCNQKASTTVILLNFVLLDLKMP